MSSCDLCLCSVCRAGQWECSGERCDAQCTVTGGMHITTFDQKRYDLQGGDCRFTAVEVINIVSHHSVDEVCVCVYYCVNFSMCVCL